MQWPYSWYNSLNDKLKSVTVFSSTIIVGAILFLFTTQQMGCKGREAMEPYAKSQGLINAHMDKMKKPDQLDDRSFAEFKAQQKILSTRKAHYLDLSILFFKNYYGVLVLLMVYSCIGGVLLFLIANLGWSNTGVGLKSLFLSVALLITFFGLFPNVFRQKENFDENLKQYMSYTKAELDIVQQLSTLSNPYYQPLLDTVVNGSPAKIFDTLTYYRKVDSLLVSNKLVINNLTNYILSIDANKVGSANDVYRSISSLLQTKADTSRR